MWFGAVKIQHCLGASKVTRANDDLDLQKRITACLTIREHRALLRQARQKRLRPSRYARNLIVAAIETEERT